MPINSPDVFDSIGDAIVSGGGGGGGVTTFVALNDTPSSYAGQGGNYVAVNSGASGLEFVSSPPGGSTTYVGLNDTPANYTGSGGFLAAVNSGATAMEFIDPSTVGVTTFTGLNDTPANYTGSGGFLAAVNSGATAMEFIDPSTVGVTTFTGLNDTPSSYSGETNKPVVVSASNTLIFSEQLKASIIGQAINYELSYTALASDGDYEGMVAKIGDAGNTLTAGTVYYWNGTQNDWVAADNTTEATSKGILGIALGASGLSDGVLISGIYYFSTPPGSAAGDVLYLSTSGGLTETVPSTTGNYLRVMGQRLDANQVMFMPSQDYIEIGSTSIDDLSDVTLTSPAAGQVLIYDGTNSIFENNTLTAGDFVKISNTDGAVTIGAGDGTEVEYKIQATAVDAAGEVEGSIVKFGTTTGMTAGEVYCFNGTNWVQVDADAEATTKGLLGVALGTAATDGLLTHGVAYLSHDPGAAGDVLYVHTTAGQVSATQPSATGDFVRVVGYCLADNKVFFSPSQDFIEIG